MRACGRCGHAVISRRTFDALDPAERAGVRRLQGHGMCSSCYETARRAGDELVPLREATSEAPARCRRCGVVGVVLNRSICRDCRDVTTDLRESGLWVEPREPVPA